MSDDVKKKILVVFPVCEQLEEDSTEFFKKFTKSLKEIEESYLQMAYDVEICWAGLSCKWSKEQKLLRENVYSFYSKIVNFSSWKNFTSSFFFIREAVSDRQAVWHAADAVRRREASYDFVAIADSKCKIDRRSWIYKTLKHSVEEEGKQYAADSEAEVMTWDFFCKMKKKGNPLFKDSEVFFSDKQLAYYTFSDDLLAFPDVSSFSSARFVCFSSKQHEKAEKNGWPVKTLSSFKEKDKLLAVCKACPENLIEGAEVSVWIEPEIAGKLNSRMLEDLSRRALERHPILLESNEEVLHKSFKFKDLLKNFSVKLLWSKLKDKMKSFDSSVIVRSLRKEKEERLLDSRILSLLSKETLNKDGFDLVLSKAVNDCKLEEVFVCKSEDFFQVYFKK